MNKNYLGREITNTNMQYWEDGNVRIDLELKKASAWSDDCNDKATHAYAILGKSELENLIRDLTDLYNSTYKEN